jgi:hypothetical protein
LDPDPLRQKAPDPNGYGSKTLVFKTYIPNTFISAMKSAPTDAPLIQMESPTDSYLWKL